MLFCCLDGVPERNVVVLFCNLLETQSLLCASTRNVPTHGASTVGLRYLIMIEFLYGNQLTNAIATLPPPPRPHQYHDDKQQDCKMYQLFMLQKTNSDLL